ncbi:MAG: DUF3795 domain-containing protein [Bacteroidota bacterium]
MSEKLIACCGLDCATCDARIATMANDDILRETTAEKWRKQYNAEGITASMINCTGCVEEGVKFAHCSKCDIRTCATAKGYKTCADCKMIDSCETIAAVHKYVPEAYVNLMNLN